MFTSESIVYDCVLTYIPVQLISTISLYSKVTKVDASEEFHTQRKKIMLFHGEIIMNLQAKYSPNIYQVQYKMINRTNALRAQINMTNRDSEIIP